MQAVVDEEVEHPGSVKVRFVHAAAGSPALDVLVRFGGSLFPVFTGVGFGETSRGNASGYFVTSPLRTSVVLRATGGSDDLLTLSDLDLAADRSLTAYAIGTTSAAATSHAIPEPSLQILLCEDANVEAPAACQLAPAQ